MQNTGQGSRQPTSVVLATFSPPVLVVVVSPLLIWPGGRRTCPSRYISALPFVWNGSPGWDRTTFGGSPAWEWYPIHPKPMKDGGPCFSRQVWIPKIPVAIRTSPGVLSIRIVRQNLSENDTFRVKLSAGRGKSMEFHQLQLLLTVIESGGYAPAGKQFHLSHSAIHRQVRLLEQELDCRLLTRSGRSVQPTESGRLLAELTSQVRREISDAHSQVRDLADLRKGSLRIGTSSSILVSFLPAVLQRFAKKYPGVSLQVITGIADDVFEDVLEGKLDMGIVFNPADLPRPMPKVEVEVLYREDFDWAVGKNHPLAGRVTRVGRIGQLSFDHSSSAKSSAPRVRSLFRIQKHRAYCDHGTGKRRGHRQTHRDWDGICPPLTKASGQREDPVLPHSQPHVAVRSRDRPAEEDLRPARPGRVPPDVPGNQDTGFFVGNGRDWRPGRVDRGV